MNWEAGWEAGLLIGFLLGACVMFMVFCFWAAAATHKKSGLDTATTRLPILSGTALDFFRTALHDSPQLDAVFVAYLTADSAQRRQAPTEERMFYDACLGGALRRIVDAQRATRADSEPMTPHRSETVCH